MYRMEKTVSVVLALVVLSFGSAAGEATWSCSWIGNSYHGGAGVPPPLFVPDELKGMGVNEDGVVGVVCPYDEGSREAGAGLRRLESSCASYWSLPLKS